MTSTIEALTDEIPTHPAWLRYLGADSGVFLAILVKHHLNLKSKNQLTQTAFFDLPKSELEETAYSTKRQKRHLAKLEQLGIIQTRTGNKKIKQVKIDFKSVGEMIYKYAHDEEIQPFTAFFGKLFPAF